MRADSLRIGRRSPFLLNFSEFLVSCNASWVPSNSQTLLVSSATGPISRGKDIYTLCRDDAGWGDDDEFGEPDLYAKSLEQTGSNLMACG